MNPGRNDPCPCGSGKKYKKCCIGKTEEELLADQFIKSYKEARHNARFKECLFPDKSLCSERIIKAHTIQRNRFLSKISENGKVYMPCLKPDFDISLMKEYGNAEASVFTGFCAYHDKVVFQPIEDRPFEGSQEQVFLFTYRAFALEYHRKRESDNLLKFFSDHPSYDDLTKEGKNGFEYATLDYEDEKKIFDQALLTHKYDILTYFIWEFEGESNFAATSGEALEYDLSKKRIQRLDDIQARARHVYYSAFPENGKTYFLISWLKEYDKLFENHAHVLSSLSPEERRNFVNNTLAFTTENIAIRPSSWTALSDTAKESYSMLFLGLADLAELNGIPVDRLEDPGFDLFAL